MPSNKPIRRGQLISPFGIGAMVDFPKDESLMPAGIDVWPLSKQECPPASGWLIREERLEARLKVSHFRLPPDHRDPDAGRQFANQSVPFIRFPLWHYCHLCGGMEKLSEFSSTRQRCQGRAYVQQSCSSKLPHRRPFLIPVRFVAVCEAGHLQDFPFMEWVHRSKPSESTCKLRMRAGRSSASLAGISLECSCGQKRNLGDVFSFNENTGGPLSTLGCYCKGHRPWLGEADVSSSTCGKHLRVLQRGASNVYFSHIVSSIYLPLWGEKANSEVIAALEQPAVWSLLSQGTVNGKIDPIRSEMVANLFQLNLEQLHATAQLKLEGKPASDSESVQDEESFRRSEYQAICDGKVGPQTELYVESSDLKEYEPIISQFFSRVQLIHKLRETRALTGFTRILPPDGSLDSIRLQSLKLDQEIDWLPATKVYGEGIFLELNSAKLEEWIGGEPEILRRLLPLVSHYNAKRTSRQQPHRNIVPKFVLLHTLAHALINQLSFDCGYGSASLRERLYCNFSDPLKPMHGLLIYTASGDSEGTMGGLVRQGKAGRMEATLRRALKQSAWCSSDPVCIESHGQGSDNANLAACHGCCLLPETSCEEGNRLLDRSLLIGTPQNGRLGYFSKISTT
jgi:hypothetical protein